MVYHAFESRLVPFVLLLVLLEEGFQSLLVLRAFLPHLSVAYLVEQQSVVVFPYEVLQLGVLCLHLGSLLVHYLLCGLCVSALLNHLLDLAVGYGVAQVASLDEFHYCGAQGVVGVYLLPLHDLYDMPSDG